MPVMTKENRPKTIPKGSVAAMNKAQAQAMQKAMGTKKKVKKK